jgi:hypothetical protein
MSNSSRDLVDAYAACLDEALTQSAMLIDRWRTDLTAILNVRYTASLQNIEKRHLRDAIQALQKHQIGLRKGFVNVLTKALAGETPLAANSKAEKSQGSSAFANFDDLELMGDHQVQDKVDNARILQTVAMESEAGLASFTARLSKAQGFEQVRADMNPLRPEVFSRALLLAVQNLPVDNAIRSLWFTHGGILMGQLVQGLYLALNDLLINRGIEPAAYRVITKRRSNSASKGSTSGFGGASGFDDFGSSAFAPADDLPEELPTIDFPQRDAKRTNAPVAASSRTQQTVNRLRRLFAGGDDGSRGGQSQPAGTEAITHHEFGHTLPSALSMLDELDQRGKATSSAPAKVDGATPSPIAQLRSQLKLQAKSLGQSLSIDVVSLMIEKVANDPRLLAPVQQIITNAEPAFLRLAVTDPRFFSDKSHPARNLLESITSESLAFASDSSPGFAEFLQELQTIGAQLTEEGASDTQHFANLLADFEKNVALRHTAAYKNHSRTAQGLLEAEQRNKLAQKIAAEIMVRPDFVFNNRVIAAFLMGPWSQVLAKERLAVDADETGINKAVFSLTLGELLWSLDAEKSGQHPKRLAKLIPSILDRLQGGLLSIDSPLARSKAFFEELLTIYQSSLKGSGESVMAIAASRSSAKNSETKIYLNGVFGSGESAYGISSWLSMLEAEQPSSKGDLAGKSGSRFKKTQPFMDTDAEVEPAVLMQTPHSGRAELRLGAWVEMIEDDQWVRAQLTWISLYKTLFVFTSEGGRTHSLNEPLLQYYLLQGMVKVISQEGVLAGALNQMERDGQTPKR